MSSELAMAQDMLIAAQPLVKPPFVLARRNQLWCIKAKARGSSCFESLAPALPVIHVGLQSRESAGQFDAAAE